MSEFEANPEFTKLLERPCEIDLVQVMLELAGDVYPALDPIGCLLEIDRLGVVCCDELNVQPGASTREQLETISRVLYEVEGFHGNRDNYYAAENSYLNEVLASRRGIPISLGIVYMAVASRCGVRAFGVNTPGHFVVGCRQGSETWYVDPFSGGDVLDRRGCKRRIERMLGCKGSVSEKDFCPAQPCDIIARVLRNLKTAYAKSNCWSRLLRVQSRLAALLPNMPQERRDLGLIYLHAGDPVKALRVLEGYLAVCCCEERDALQSSVQVARRMVAQLN
jgi:regulator of sirC expression with transglutaminase-like and TPR domain